MQIRQAKPSDIAFIKQGLQEVYQLAGDEEAEAQASVEEDQVEDLIEQGKIRVIEIEGELAGFWRFKDPFQVMYLEDAIFWVAAIYVAPKHREKGVGKALHDDAIREAKSRGKSKIALDVFTVNQNSTEFHQHIGFKPVYTIYEREI